MRLINADREAFIQAVLDDVPQIDYDEVARSKINAWAVSRMPEALAKAYKEYPGFFKNGYYYTPGSLNGCYAVGEDSRYDIEDRDPVLWKELEELANQKTEQSNKLRDLRVQLRGVIFSCTTLKKAEELLPEFKKYLPADRDGQTDRKMPVISNLVATLTEAGWPKDQPLAQGA